jgi:hypothetical protein
MQRTREKSRSHDRLVRDTTKASERRQRLLDGGRLSLPSGAGKLAIIVSRFPDHNNEVLTPRKQYQAFLEEADRLKQQRSQNHQQVVVRPVAVAGDMKIDFGDPEVTDIILISHGTISFMRTDSGQYFDWRTAARAASYLKQGVIEQRMCGNLLSREKKTDKPGIKEELPHRYSVPLGTFAVSNLTHITAATGLKIPDVDPSDDLFRPVFSESHGAAEQIQALNEAYVDTPTVVIT